MLSNKEIDQISFKKANIGGYKVEDVEEFVLKVKDSFSKLESENKSLVERVTFLASKVNEYRNTEESLKIALDNTQKFAGSSIENAKNLANDIIRDAKKKAEEILKNTETGADKYQKELIDLKKSVKDFKNTILNAYKEHLKQISALPEDTDVPNSKQPELSRVAVGVRPAGQEKFKKLQFGEEYKKFAEVGVDSSKGLFN